MIKKEELLQRINAVLELEKRITPLLNKHVSSSLFFSGLGKDERDAIVEGLQGIVINKTKHLDILNGIKDGITKGKKDVY
jgi:hypothetical protein